MRSCRRSRRVTGNLARRSYSAGGRHASSITEAIVRIVHEPVAQASPRPGHELEELWCGLMAEEPVDRLLVKEVLREVLPEHQGSERSPQQLEGEA